MRPEHMKYADIEVPRYTSYPTAAQFHDEIGEADYRSWLAKLRGSQNISLYVHVPFCKQMCWYCGCHTTIVHSYERVAAYLEILHREIKLLADAIPGHARLSHVHFGGGTPTMIDRGDFIALMNVIAQKFSLSSAARIAIEIDPRTLSEQKARTLGHAGVTRASLGVQDFAPHVQARINRIQPFYVVDRAVKWLRGSGVCKINFDLMYGLPGQKLTDVERTVELSLALKPDRIAVFGYAHVPWFKKHQSVIRDEDLPGVRERFQQAQLAGDMLRHSGYVEIGFDHYARPDDEMAIAMHEKRLKRNFQGYSEDEADILLGLGASSIGAMAQGYVQNAPGLDRYRELVSAGHLPIVRGTGLTRDDILRRAAIERIMTDLELDVAALCGEFGHQESALDGALEALGALEADGLISRNGRLLTVREEGRLFLRIIAAQFDAYWQPGPARHSRAV